MELTGGAARNGSYLTRMVQDHPFSLILLDEIEKAHPTVLNLFLQILDEGIMTDAQGARVDFTNCIIIATSNAGAEFIRTTLRDHPGLPAEDFRKAVVEMVLQQDIFSPEFVNRFDEVVVFQPLSKESAMKVAGLMAAQIVAEVAQRKGIHVELAEDVLAALVEKGYSLEFGARELRRTVTKILEDYLADYLLSHTVERGTTLRITRADIRL